MVCLYVVFFTQRSASHVGITQVFLKSWTLPPSISRRIRHQHQGLGRRGRVPVQEVHPQQPAGGAGADARPLPPVAREALRRRAVAGPVSHVHAVQGHERGLARPAGDAVLGAREGGPPPQAEPAAEDLRGKVNSNHWRDCSPSEKAQRVAAAAALGYIGL